MNKKILVKEDEEEAKYKLVGMATILVEEEEGFRETFKTLKKQVRDNFQEHVTEELGTEGLEEELMCSATIVKGIGIMD